MRGACEPTGRSAGGGRSHGAKDTVPIGQKSTLLFLFSFVLTVRDFLKSFF